MTNSVSSVNHLSSIIIETEQLNNNIICGHTQTLVSLNGHQDNLLNEIWKGNKVFRRTPIESFPLKR